MLKKAGPKSHILLVDDDQCANQLLSMLLESRGYSVEIAFCGEDALKQVSPQIDLVLLDTTLPDQDGHEVCRQLRENKNSQNIPIIILSAKVLPDNIVECLYSGADDYISKPFHYEELVARMEAVMRRSSTFNNGKVTSQGQERIIRELKDIIVNRKIVPYFQPIFALDPLRLLGFEALCRPQTDGILNNPELLFKAALQFGMYSEMEMISWEMALEYASNHLVHEKLFLNCNPYLVESQELSRIQSMFDNSKIRTDNVVLEITERSAISEYKIFFENLTHFREAGFQFAIDDVGGGYASLESIVRTKPEVVKIDRHITTEIAKDPFKLSIVKFIVAFCKEQNIISIAEGIETKEDFDTVRALGVDAGQGYYLFRPIPEINFQKIHQTVSCM
jgi:EAL domain-containing protein (putative c-di-GMP-specific phosphodiesterase class I)/ActR/RegA family two-component response regulator